MAIKNCLSVLVGAVLLGTFAPGTCEAQNAFYLRTTDGGAINFSGVLPQVGLTRGNFLPNDTDRLLRLPQIQKELALQDDQVEAVGKLSAAMREQMSEIFKHADFGGDDVGKVMREAQAAIRIKNEEKLEELLSPQQLERLKQIKVQMALRRAGAVAVLGGRIADELHLSDKQKEKLNQVHATHQAEFAQEVERLRKKYRDATLKEVLTHSQLDSLEKLSGEEYDVKPPDISAMYPGSAAGKLEAIKKKVAAQKRERKD